MKLYYFETSNSRKPCAVAKYLSSPVDFIYLDLTKGDQKQEAFLAINPNGKAPALKDGDIHLWEGHAIMAYLAQQAGSDLWPGDPIEQINVMKWLNWDTAHFARWGNALMFENNIKAAFGMGEPDPVKVNEAEGFFRQFAAVLNGHLKGRDFMVGNGLSIADFGVASVLPMASQARLPLDGCDEIRRWHDGMMQIEAWADPWPQKPKQEAA